MIAKSPPQKRLLPNDLKAALLRNLILNQRARDNDLEHQLPEEVLRARWQGIVDCATQIPGTTTENISVGLFGDKGADTLSLANQILNKIFKPNKEKKFPHDFFEALIAFVDTRNRERENDHRKLMGVPAHEYKPFIDRLTQLSGDTKITPETFAASVKAFIVATEGVSPTVAIERVDQWASEVVSRSVP